MSPPEGEGLQCQQVQQRRDDRKSRHACPACHAYRRTDADRRRGRQPAHRPSLTKITPPQDILDWIHRDTLNHTGGHQADDVAMLAVHHLRSGQPRHHGPASPPAPHHGTQRNTEPRCKTRPAARPMNSCTRQASRLVARALAAKRPSRAAGHLDRSDHRFVQGSHEPSSVRLRIRAPPVRLLLPRAVSSQHCADVIRSGIAIGPVEVFPARLAALVGDSTVRISIGAEHGGVHMQPSRAVSGVD